MNEEEKKEAEELAKEEKPVSTKEWVFPEELRQRAVANVQNDLSAVRALYLKVQASLKNLQMQVGDVPALFHISEDIGSMEYEIGQLETKLLRILDPQNLFFDGDQE